MAGKIKGVFLQEKLATIGTGHTAKRVTQKIFCQAEQVSEAEVKLQYLGENGEPLNIVENMPLEEFVRSFTLQSEYHKPQKTKDNGNIDAHISQAEEHTRKNEPFSAEFEYKNALKVDEENLKANFGIGNVYLSLGQEEKAKEIFSDISKIDAIFEEENKHFFNECGIQLRKQELYVEAIDYYN